MSDHSGMCECHCRAALYTVKEAAAVLSVSMPTVYRLFASGALRYVQIGAHRRVAVSEIDRFIEAHSRPQRMGADDCESGPDDSRHDGGRLIDDRD